jgi:hypothetical protein
MFHNRAQMIHLAYKQKRVGSLTSIKPHLYEENSNKPSRPQKKKYMMQYKGADDSEVLYTISDELALGIIML